MLSLNRKYSRILLLYAIIALTAFSLPVFSQETPEPEKKTLSADELEIEELSSMSLDQLMNVIIVTASAKKEAAISAPANITVYTGKEMKERGYRTLRDLMKDLPGLSMVGQFDINNSSHPVIRGSDGPKLLKLMINGMVVDSQNGYGPILAERYPIEGIDRVEFILGPYASLYGRNAYSGVLNIITKKGKDLQGGTVSLLYGRHHQLQATAIYANKWGGFDCYLSLFKNYSKQGIDLAEEYPEYYSVENRKNGTLWGSPVTFADGVSTDYVRPWDNNEIYFRVSHDIGIQLDFQYNHAKIPKVGDSYTPLFYASPEDAENNDTILNTRLKYDFSIKDIFSSSTSIVLQNYDCIGRNYYLDGTKKWYANESRGITLDEKLRYKVLDWKETYRNEIYLGISYELVKDKPLAYSWGSEPTWSDDDIKIYKFLNITVQDEMKIFDRVTIVGGLMYEHSNLYNDVFIPRVSSVVKIFDRTFIKLLYGKGFVTPDTEVGVDQVGIGENVKGTTGLNPEMITSYDVNVIHGFSDFMWLNVSGYYTTADNNIQKVNDSSLSAPFTSTWKNIGESTTYGTDITFNWKFKNLFKIFASYSYVDGSYEKVDSSGSLTTANYIPLTTRHRVKAGLNLFIWEGWFNLFILYSYIGNRYTWHESADSNNYAYQFDTPGYKLDPYHLVDINIKTTSNLHKNLSLSFGVRNLLDKKAFDPAYSDFSISVHAPLRRRYWTVQAEFSF
ncbi:MAG: TonB-dependent receptor [bacterium]|nr:TonB-dependent receptor [bacterium]